MSRSRSPAALKQGPEVSRRYAERDRPRSHACRLGDLRHCLPTALELDAVLQESARGVGLLLHAAAASLWRVDEAAGRLQAGAFWSRCPDYTAPPQTIGLEQDVLGWVVRQVRPCNVPDLYRDTRFRALDYWRQSGWCSFFGLPLLIEDRLFAVLACHDAAPFVLDGEAEEILGTFVVCVGTALQHAILYTTEATARRAAEAAAYAQTSLVVRQASLYATATLARTALEAATRAKNAFLATMSHELRTPLNAVINYSELLQEEAAEQGHLGYIADLQKIQAAGRHLLTLVNCSLDFARIEAGKVELACETFHVPYMVHDLVATVQPLLAQNANTLEVRIADDVALLHADRLKVQQSLQQLLHNACKFTTQGRIVLDVACEMAADRPWMRFEVRDTGIGMSPEQLAQLFRPFTPGDDTSTRKYGGTGLGLAISKGLCQLMGGEITVTSTVGQGSTFTIRLPVDCESSPAGSEKEQA